MTEDAANLHELIMDAYNVKDFQVSGGPDWVTSHRDVYVINAKSEGARTPTLSQVRLMLQALLVDRFQLKFHREMKDVPVYELAIAKTGKRLKEVPADATPEGDATADSARARTIARTSMLLLVDWLSMLADRPIVDKTGLVGTYEYSTDWTRREMNMNRKGAAEEPGTADSLFAAVQKQLGLKLEAKKNRVECLMIDRAEKPSEN